MALSGLRLISPYLHGTRETPLSHLLPQNPTIRPTSPPSDCDGVQAGAGDAAASDGDGLSQPAVPPG